MKLDPRAALARAVGRALRASGVRMGHATGFWGMPTLIGYNYVHTYPGGQQAMHQDALILQIPDVPFTLSQGKQLTPIPLPFTGFTAIWTFDLEPICP